MSQQRVLLADADALLLDQYRAHLTRAGFDVATAQTGLECLEQLGNAPPNVLVLDPRLMTQFSEGVFDILAAADDLPGTRVIVLTSHDCDLNSRLATIPIDAWLAKPLSASILAEHIRRLLKLSAESDRFVTEWA